MSVWQTAADDAVNGLVAAAETISDVVVHDSLVISDAAAMEEIVVAGSLDTDNTSDRAFIEHKFGEPGYTSDVEDIFTVWSEIGVLKGGASVSAARSRCYVILRDWAQVIADDPTLGGAVDAAWVAEVAWKPQQTEDGALAVLLVGIDCREFTGP